MPLMGFSRELYNFSIAAYTAAIRVVAPFHPKAREWVRGRKSISQKLQNIEPGNYIWMHCASLGEFEQGRPVAEKLLELYPDKKLILTFFSPSGYNIRKNYEKAEQVLYLPADTPDNARHFLDHVQPELAIFVKYEFWLNYLKELKSRQVPHVLISAIFREEQPFFKWYGKLFLEQLRQYDHIFVQDDASEQLLENYNVRNVSIAPDTRFDRVITVANQSAGDAKVEVFLNKQEAIVCGSTWPEDEKVISQWWKKNATSSLKLLIAPHEVGEEHVLKLQSLFPGAVRYTKWENKSEESQVMIIDTIGKLASLYKYGVIAYVGGGFGAGIHNVLEPAVYGLPVVFGPNYQKFKEAHDLIRCGGGYSVANFAGFESQLNRLLSDEGVLKRAGGKAGKYVHQSGGGTRLITEFISKHLFRHSEAPPRA